MQMNQWFLAPCDKYPAELANSEDNYPMLLAYLNYPNTKISVHRDPSCRSIGKMNKAKQRWVRINLASISDELRKFKQKQYTFAANPSANDMWIEIDFGDTDYEIATLQHVQRLIGQHYLPFRRIEVETHC
jgi:hypothetical protein